MPPFIYLCMGFLWGVYAMTLIPGFYEEISDKNFSSNSQFYITLFMAWGLSWITKFAVEI